MRARQVTGLAIGIAALAFVLGCGGDDGGAAAAGGTVAGTPVTGGTGVTTGGTPVTGGTGVVTGGTGVVTGGMGVTGGTGAGMTAGMGTGGMVTGGMGAGMAGMAGTGTGGMGVMEPFALTSSVVMEGGMIPATYRCAKASSPPLSWTAGPAGTMSYAIVFKDIGAFAGTMHWVIYDIPASVTMLAEGVPAGAMPATPAGAKQANNWEGAAAYTGPCSPLPGSNMYEFKIYALPTATLAAPGTTGTMVETALTGAMPLGTATLKITSTT